MSDLDRYYEMFELEPEASPERVKQAYRDLVRIWHPDRFSHDPRLQHKAQERLKEINEAYERLLNSPPGLSLEAKVRANPSWAPGSRKIVLAGLLVVMSFVGGGLDHFEGRPDARTGQIQLDENISVQELIAEGRSFYLAKDYRRALPYFQKAIEKNPSHAKSWYQAGYCHYKLGHYEKAIEAFHKASRLRPEDAEAYRGLGLVYAKQRRFHDAIGALNQAAQITPGDAALYYNLGLIYLRLGDRDGALLQYEILRDLNAERATELYKLIS